MAWVADNSCNDSIICCKLWVKCFSSQKLECITQCVMHPITRCNLPVLMSLLCRWNPYILILHCAPNMVSLSCIWAPILKPHIMSQIFLVSTHHAHNFGVQFSEISTKKPLFDSLVAYSCSSLISLKEVCAVPLTILLISILLHSRSVSFLTIVFTLGSASKHAQSIIYSVLPKKRSW